MKKVISSILLLVVITSIFGQSKTICLESIQKEEKYIFCISQKSIEEAFKASSIEKCKITKNDQGYTKFCFLNISGNNSFSQILLVSYPMSDSNKKAECEYMEFFYKERILYMPKKNEKLWWQATNLLNNVFITSPE